MHQKTIKEMVDEDDLKWSLIFENLKSKILKACNPRYQQLQATM